MTKQEQIDQLTEEVKSVRDSWNSCKFKLQTQEKEYETLSERFNKLKSKCAEIYSENCVMTGKLQMLEAEKHPERRNQERRTMIQHQNYSPDWVTGKRDIREWFEI